MAMVKEFGEEIVGWPFFTRFTRFLNPIYTWARTSLPLVQTPLEDLLELGDAVRRPSLPGHLERRGDHV
jgi:hypothetical protein